MGCLWKAPQTLQNRPQRVARFAGPEPHGKRPARSCAFLRGQQSPPTLDLGALQLVEVGQFAQLVQLVIGHAQTDGRQAESWGGKWCT